MDGFIEQQFNIECGRKIMEQRRKMGVHQQNLALEVGVHRNTLSAWEAGERGVPLWMFLRIADMLRCNLLHLLPSSSYTWGELRRFTAERDPALTREEREA